MKNHFLQPGSNAPQTHVELYSIINRISATSIPSATRKHSFIVNDVPKELEVTTNENMLATVFGSLLHTVINNTENCCIRISARVLGNVVVLHLKESHSRNWSAFAGSLRQVQQLAEKIGGTVSVSANRNEASTIFFSFLNNLPLAA